MKTVLLVLAWILVLPFLIGGMMLFFVFFGVMWACGVPVTVKMNNEEYKYRWFSRI